MTRAKQRPTRFKLDSPAFAAAVTKAAEELNISVMRMCRELGLQPSLMTRLRAGDEGCRFASIASLAAYVGVNPMDYVIDLDEEEKCL